MDALYGELDELSSEALKRHVEGCARCGGVLASLRSTRAAIEIPLVEPSEALEQRILAAERTAVKHMPWHRKVVRAAAWAGSHAMRPQLAMAALFMFVIGSSMMLLRARPGTLSPPVTVRDEGRPGTEEAPAAAAAEQQARRSLGEGRATSKDIDGLTGAQEKTKEADDVGKAETFKMSEAAAGEAAADEAAAGEAAAGESELAQALQLKANSGCADAAKALKEVEQRFPGSAAAGKAKAAARDCDGFANAEAAPMAAPNSARGAPNPSTAATATAMTATATASTSAKAPQASP
jgi:hypothetical protein